MRRVLMTLMLCLVANSCYAEVVNKEALCDAIYKAEGGANTKHPYGIMQKYKHTTPRQACINTVTSAMKRYEVQGAKEEFIAFLGKTYAPVGADNDPRGLNVNWVPNVRRLYANSQ